MTEKEHKISRCCDATLNKCRNQKEDFPINFACGNFAWECSKCGSLHYFSKNQLFYTKRESKEMKLIKQTKKGEKQCQENLT